MTPPPNTRNYTPIKGEEWRPVPGTKYWASNKGRIFTPSAHNKPNNPAILKPALDFDKRRNTTGYLRTVLNGKSVRIHRVIAKIWVPNPENKPSVNHINGDRSDNRAENLEWCTTSENILHAYRTGLEKKQLGQRHHAAKITDEQVRQFKWEWAHNRKMSRKQYAEKLGVTEGTIKDIIRGRSWGWLTV